MRILALACVFALICTGAYAAVIVSIPLDQQVNIGLGDAITGHSSFESYPDGGCVRRALTVGHGANDYYDDPNVDLVNAGYGPYVDMSVAGTTIEYTARYFQGGPNAYSDAPIMISLKDVNDKWLNLGISYGAQPDPTYPSWITVTDDLTPSNEDPGFDASKVVYIHFWGTDWPGLGDDFIEIRNLRVTNSATQKPIPIAQAKNQYDGDPVEITGAISAIFRSESRFYVEDPHRICGIQVRASSTPSSTGISVYVTGSLQTDDDTGEAYVQASFWSPAGGGSVAPLMLPCKSLGGGPFGRQVGACDGVGLNNVGLLVKVCGYVADVASDHSFFRLDDGSRVCQDTLVDLSGIPFWQRPAIADGSFVTVTGISTLRDYGRVVRMADPSGLYDPNSDGNEPKTIRVLVVNFDPFCPGYGGLPTHEVFGWGDPGTLAQGYIDDLYDTSGGWCRYEIVDWFTADYHPYFEDGFQYSPDDFVWTWNQGDTELFHTGSSDYIRLATDTSYPHNQPRTIAERIADDEIDEVFFFGAPYGAAFSEAAMAGPSPFFVNGATYEIPEAGRNFVMMGFNYERDVDCMLEDFLHRTECVMSRVYSPPDWWFPTWPIQNNWDRFRMFDMIEPGQAACGICHYAPNGVSDYDWGNTNYVWSTCDDWLYNWPDLQGESTRRWVNCEEWGDGDMRLHHVWWLNHFPKAPGINPDSKQNNWWKYTCDFNNYAETR